MSEKKTTKKMKYYSLDNILKEEATYNVIIGERSNGKTFAVLSNALKDYCEKGWQLALVRRWGEDFTGKRGQQMFDAIVENGLVEKYTNGKWTYIKYRASRWWLAKYDEKLDKEITDIVPFAFGFALNAGEHDKSTSYPRVKNILFDEFLTRGMYLPDEFVLFMNTLSTIIRENDGVRIFMCANTVNKYAPYFTEMGLTNVEKMKQGTIDVYNYGDSDLKVAVEYCASNKHGKKSDKYFAFNNPKLKMITGGAWELSIYPHLPIKYQGANVKFKYYIQFGNNMLECKIIKVKDERNVTCYFTYIHRKTSELKDKKKDIIFSTDYSPKPNWFRKLAKPTTQLEKKLYYFFAKEKVFYQDNEVGEVVRNYLNWCISDKIV